MVNTAGKCVAQDGGVVVAGVRGLGVVTCVFDDDTIERYDLPLDHTCV